MARQDAKYLGLNCSDSAAVVQARQENSNCVLERVEDDGSISLFFHTNPRNSVPLQGRELRDLLQGKKAKKFLSKGEKIMAEKKKTSKK